MKRKQQKYQKQSKRHIQQLLPLSQCGLFQDDQSKYNIIYSMKNNKFGSKCKLQPIARSDKKQIEENDDEWINQVSYFEQSKVYEPHKLLQHTKNDELENILQSRFASLNNSIISIKSKVKLQSINPTVKSIHTTHLKQCYLSKMNVLKRPNATMLSSTHMFSNIWSNFQHKSFEKSLSSLRCHKIQGIQGMHQKQNSNESYQKENAFLSKTEGILNNRKQMKDIYEQGNSFVPNFLLTTIKS